MAGSEKFTLKGQKFFWFVTLFKRGGYKNFYGEQVFWHRFRILIKAKRHKLLETVFKRER